MVNKINCSSLINLPGGGGWGGGLVSGVLPYKRLMGQGGCAAG